MNTSFREVFYHWAPPAIGALLTLAIGFMIRQFERKRMKDEEEAKKFRADIKLRITTIRQQNGWFIRKLIEVITVNNLKYPDSHIAVDDYPNGNQEPD